MSGALAGKKPSEKIGRSAPLQAQIARLRRQLKISELRRDRTEVALKIMSKTHEHLETLSKSSRDETPHAKS